MKWFQSWRRDNNNKAKIAQLHTSQNKGGWHNLQAGRWWWGEFNPPPCETVKQKHTALMGTSWWNQNKSLTLLSAEFIFLESYSLRHVCDCSNVSTAELVLFSVFPRESCLRGTGGLRALLVFVQFICSRGRQTKEVPLLLSWQTHCVRYASDRISFLSNHEEEMRFLYQGPLHFFLPDYTSEKSLFSLDAFAEVAGDTSVCVREGEC